MKLTHPTIA